MPLVGDIAFSQGDIMRRLADLERQVRELSAARRLEAATIGDGGVTIAGGTLRILDGTGALAVQAGLLDDGTYGLASVDGTGKTVKLGQLAFGLATDVDTAMGTTSSPTYTDLTGADVGPEVTVTIGDTGRAVVFFSAEMGFTGAYQPGIAASASVAVSGATTIAASADWNVGFRVEVDADGISVTNQGANIHVFEGLAPGETTFTMQYRSVMSVPNVQFRQRELVILPY